MSSYEHTLHSILEGCVCVFRAHVSNKLVNHSHTRLRFLVMMNSLLQLTLVAGVAGHGALYIPTPRNAMDRVLPEFEGGKSPQGNGYNSCTCNNGNGGPTGPSEGCDMGLRGGVDAKGDGQSCLWWSQGCSIGCDTCATETAGTHPITGNPPNPGKLGFRKRYCNSTFEPTLPKHAWTLNMEAREGSEEDSYRFNPWRAPGHAPVVDPCGMAGGEHGYQHLGGDSVFFNTSIAQMGMLGSMLPPTPQAHRSVWTAGSYVEVAWGIRYNHGGGYSYRLCPAHEPLTEACFQQTPLEFDRSAQVLKWSNGSLSYPMKDQAIFVDEGTRPEGSTWARNPIPRICKTPHVTIGSPEPDPRGEERVGLLSLPPPPPSLGLVPPLSPCLVASTDSSARTRPCKRSCWPNRGLKGRSPQPRRLSRAHDARCWLTPGLPRLPSPMPVGLIHDEGSAALRRRPQQGHPRPLRWRRHE